MLLVGRFLVGVGGRDHHLIDLQLVVEEVEHLAHRLGRVLREEGRVGRHAKAPRLGLLDRGDRHIEDALAFDRGVVALAQPVDVDRPCEVGAGLEFVELALQQDRVGAQVHESPARHQLAGDQVYLGVHERLAARDRDHRGAALLDRPHGLLDRHPLTQDVVGMLDLAAAGAGQVALKQRLELDQQREALAFGQPLAHQVPAHVSALPKAHRHARLP